MVHGRSRYVKNKRKGDASSFAVLRKAFLTRMLRAKNLDFVPHPMAVPSFMSEAPMQTGSLQT